MEGVGGGAHHAQEVILAHHIPVPELHPQRGRGPWHLPQLQHLIPVWEASLLNSLAEEKVRDRADGDRTTGRPTHPAPLHHSPKSPSSGCPKTHVQMDQMCQRCLEGPGPWGQMRKRVEDT